MNNDIYEVLESSASGLRLQIEFQPRANYSLGASGIPFIRSLVVHNESGAELAGIDLEATLDLTGSATETWRLALPGPIAVNSVTRIDDPRQFAVFAPLLARATESTPATLDVRATAAGSTGEVRVLAAIEVSAFNEWLNYPGLHGTLAAFVQPNTRTITSILRAASDLLMKRTHSGSLEGYQGGPDRANQIAGAVYEALRALDITYINPPASFERTGQKVRTTEQVLRDKFGTCVDLAVLYAACLEAVGLYPVLFITRNHSFAGFFTSDTFGDVAVVDQVNALTNMVEIGLVHPVELTGIGPGRGSLNFADASKVSSAYFRTNFDYLQSMVDVTRARVDGIRPMPQIASPDDMVEDEASLDLDRPFVAKSSLRNLSMSATATAEVVRGVLDRDDDSPARFKNWKRDLLDLSLRNPLLNMPHTQKVLDLVVPGGMLPMLDDVVHAGKSVRVAGGMDVSEVQKLAGIRVASEIPADLMMSMFQTTRTVYSTLPTDKHRGQLRAMKREADTLEQETGSNYLYLTLGTLVHTRADGKEARAPLFLLPVRLTGGLAFTPYAMKLDGEEIAQPNLCLLQWLKTTQGLDLTDLASPALDDSGLAIGATLTGIRQQLLDAELPYRIDESASLAILRFSTFQIWKDLDENWEPLMRNSVVRHLVETPGETFADPAGSLEPVVDETSLRLPIAADGSQMAAIVRATSGQSFVLEGPPGTGKSQTITNLIAHALTGGKKVLFVAEKQAALEVVKRRLDAVGLGAFGLELHGAKQSMNSIRDQLRAAIDLRVTVDQNAWDATDARLRSAIVELEHYPELVHAANAQGYSLWSAYDAVATLGEGDAATIPLPWLSSAAPTASATDIATLTREFSDAATRFGLVPGHPWLVSGTADATTLALPAVRDALSDLRAAHTRVTALGAEWTAALPELHPAAGLSAAVGLLAARDRGLLPTPGHVAYIDRSSWREASTSLRRSVTDYRTVHAQVLSEATEAAFELTDLPELIARSEKLDGSWFFPELRRRGIRARVDPLLRDGITMDGAAFTALLIRARDARAAADPIVAARTQLQGLLLADPWAPYRDDAAATLEAAVWTSQTAVWVSRHAPTAWRILPATAPADADVLRDIDGVWTAWLAALGGSQRSVRQWSAGSDWVQSWATSEAIWSRDVEATGLLQPQRFAETRRLLERIRDAGLAAFADQLGGVTIRPANAPEALLRGLARASLEERTSTGSLDSFDRDAHDRTSSAYLEQGVKSREQLRSAVAARLIAQRPFDATNLRGEVAELKRQIDRKRGGLSFREVAKRYPRALTSVVPCFLMSPGSVAHFLDADSLEFDLVVFDEASQIRVPQAIGAMGRGKAVVVVGDSKQMPPTRVMQVEAASEVDSSAEELVVEDLESILTEAVESGLPQLWLNWHYRSHDESLIAFSNATYYDDKLISLPSPRTTDDTGLSLRRVDGVFDRGRTRTNEVEAQAIVDDVRSRLADPATRGQSLGVVCFNIQQRDLILNKLEDSDDLLVQRALTAEPGQEIFVKNLENVQGDERDTILFSLAFSPDPVTRVLPLNFGPLNLAGGERRLNVAVTRARSQIVLFSSFDPGDIDLSRTNARGIADLRRYMEFASSRSLVRSAKQDAAITNRGRMVEEIAAALETAGYETQAELGLSSFRVDLAARTSGDDEWRAAIMVDGPGWASRPTVSDRDGSPQLLVDLMGWSRIIRVWLPGWIRDREGALASIIAELERPFAARERFVSVAAPGETAGDDSAASAVRSPAVPGAALATSPAAAAADRVRPSALDLPVFRAADDSVIASQSVLGNMRMAQPAIQRIATEILATEGVIPLTRLIATVARRFGYSRIGEDKRDDLAESIRSTFTTIDGFVWPADREPLTWRGASRSPSTSVRTLAEVSPHEIANVMELVLREAFSMTPDELMRETAEELGYGRLTQAGRVLLERGLEVAFAASRVLADGDRLTLPSTEDAA